MSKKGTKIELNQTKEDEGGSILDSKVDESIESTNSRLNAEDVTKLATDFLLGLGHKRAIPNKVSQEGPNYFVIEVGLKKKNALVVVDANAKEIKEYEINAPKKVSKSAISATIPKIILLIVGLQVLLRIILNLVSNYLPISFL